MPVPEATDGDHPRSAGMQASTPTGRQQAAATPAIPAPSVPVPATTTAVPPVLMTELAPTQGDLLPLLVSQVERGKSKGLVTVVEFYADWCPPCRTFQENLDDPRMREALRGAYIVKVNMDDWHDKLKGTGYVVPSIPAFHVVKADGRPSGKVLDGNRWRKPTAETMSAALALFLAATAPPGSP